jgi:hypothetical protein
MKRQSKKLGYKSLGGHPPTCVMVYEALIPIQCEGCPHTIIPGERFTRRNMIGGGNRTYPFCAKCEPCPQ